VTRYIWGEERRGPACRGRCRGTAAAVECPYSRHARGGGCPGGSVAVSLKTLVCEGRLHGFGYICSNGRAVPAQPEHV
jgi:hypothetical protein